MLVLQRASEVGRQYSFIGALGACAVAAFALSPTKAIGEASHETPPADSMATRMQLASLLPEPVPAPFVRDFELAPPPGLLEALAEVLDDYDDMARSAAQAVNAELARIVAAPRTPAVEARPMHGWLSHAYSGHRRSRVVAMRVSNTEQLARVFQAHDYSLDHVRRGQPIPALQIDRVPADLAAVKDGNQRKWLFIKALLPIVLQANERILAERNELLRLRDVAAAGAELSVGERLWLADLAERYGGDPSNIVEMLQRVDVVPPSMAIAQAGVESGWGTSYAARVGNALFGQIQASGRHAVEVPWKAGPAMPQPFANVSESVEAYFLNLNTHFAYASFRVERAQLRARGAEPDGYRLMGQLLRYSQLGAHYISYVRNIIRENQLSDFDSARLSPS
ncbi:MAG: glucosaminidase domain-containing protein [Reyranellaceae bacterium]